LRDATERVGHAQREPARPAVGGRAVQRGKRGPPGGRHATAIARYTEAIELLPTFPEAYHNRATAHANSGDERSCERDLLTAFTLDYDTEEFWPTFFNHVNSPLVISLLTDAELPSALTDRLRSRTEEAVQRGTLFLRQYPDHGIRFSPGSLPARYWLSRLVSRPEYLPAEVFTGVFDLCCDSTWGGDEELTWRAKFLVATVLYEEYQTTEWSPDGQGGVFFDDDYLTHRPHWELPDGLLRSLVSARMPPTTASRRSTISPPSLSASPSTPPRCYCDGARPYRRHPAAPITTGASPTSCSSC
jgi:hypothetical protein